MLSRLRQVEFINKPIMLLLKGAKSKTNGFLDYVMKRWPTSGITECDFRKQKFLMYNHCDDGLVNYFVYNWKYHEEGDLQLFIKLSTYCNVIADVGANTGLYSILVSKASSNASIIAFEPYTVNYKRLQKNIELNNCRNVICEKVALGERESEVEMTVPVNDSITDVASLNEDFPDMVYKGLKWKKEKVKLQTLDSYSKSKDLKIDLIKCDVETYEINFFMGIDQILRHDRPTIIFESFIDNERIAFFNDILKKYNYYLYLVLEQGIVYMREGFSENRLGINFLIVPIEPKKSFIAYDEIEQYKDTLLLKGL